MLTFLAFAVIACPLKLALLGSRSTAVLRRRHDSKEMPVLKQGGCVLSPLPYLVLRMRDWRV